MRAAVYTEFRGPIEVQELPDPAPAQGEIVVRVQATGVCRSDWHGWQGHDPDIRSFPHVPGHELAGVIESVGTDIVGWHRGDRVTVPFVAGCGQCEQCRAGDPQVCPNQVQPGFTHWGSFAELVTIRHAQHNLVRIPDEFGFTETAVLGCRFSTAYRAVVEQGRLTQGEWVAVHGCGGVGLSAVMIASAVGGTVIAIDTNPAALELAASFGAAHALSPGPDLASQVAAVSGGGVHLGIDAIGNAYVVATSLASLRRSGRHVQVGLLPNLHVPLRLDRLIARELKLLGSHGIAAASFPAMFDLISSRGMNIRSLVAQELTLEDGARLLETFGDRTEPGIAVITGF
jgi:D-arabinose 1-dehydrogenase-like Zn-dependent alcohol dehydrogenase